MLEFSSMVSPAPSPYPPHSYIARPLLKSHVVPHCSGFEVLPQFTGLGIQIGYVVSFERKELLYNIHGLTKYSISVMQYSDHAQVSITVA